MNPQEVKDWSSRMCAYRNKQNEVQTDMEKHGIYQMMDLTHLTGKKLGEAQAKMSEATMAQLNYNLFNNVPCGIIKISEVVESAVKHGMVSMISNHIKWDIRLALEICADILEDCNAHPEAAKLREMSMAEDAKHEFANACENEQS